MWLIDLPLWFWLLFYTGPILTIIWLAILVVKLIKTLIIDKYRIVKRT